MSADTDLEEILTHCDYTMKTAFDILEQNKRATRTTSRSTRKQSE